MRNKQIVNKIVFRWLTFIENLKYVPMNLDAIFRCWTYAVAASIFTESHLAPQSLIADRYRFDGKMGNWIRAKNARHSEPTYLAWHAEWEMIGIIKGQHEMHATSIPIVIISLKKIAVKIYFLVEFINFH